MKKILLVIAIVGVIAGSSNAQTRSKLHIGLKAGANYSNVYDSEGEAFNADAKFGLAAGAFFAIPLGKFVGVQPRQTHLKSSVNKTKRLYLLGKNRKWTLKHIFQSYPTQE